MQEQVHHQEHQRDGFQQGLHHVLNRRFNKGGRFIGDFVLQPVREILGKLVQTVQHQFRRGHFVCAGGKLYPQTGGLIAVKAAQVVVFFRPHFHRGDIAQTHFRTILIHAQGDVAELVRRLQQGL